jgi:phage terminase large subunit-like protein
VNFLENSRVPPSEKSLITTLAMLPVEERRKLLSGLSAQELEDIKYCWRLWARPSQMAPSGDWKRWLILAGRGFGKTLAGAQWVRSIACGPTPDAPGLCKSIAIIAETTKDAREVIAQGGSGILAVHPPEFRPSYTERKGFTWPNGCRAYLYSANEPDQLRGLNADAAWCDELCKWPNPVDVYDMLSFALRVGDDPRMVITTTPRPIQLLKKIMAAASTVVTTGSTYENAGNLSESFIRDMKERYAGTRLGRQELQAEILGDTPGALWTRGNLDEHRIGLGKNGKRPKLPDMQRVVVGVDPAVAVLKTDIDENAGTAETGIVVAGLGVDGRAYVLDDCSVRGSPRVWARRALAAMDFHKGDCIIVEINNGGAMVKACIQAERPLANVIEVHASRGKVARAEPIASLFEQGRVSMVGSFPELEDQLVLFTPYGIVGNTLADRADSMIWAISHLFPSIVHHVNDDEAPVYENFAGRSSVSGY